jgi:hypothetical protein
MKLFKVTIVILIVFMQSCATLTPDEAQTTVKELVIRVQQIVDLINARTNTMKIPSLNSAVIKLSQTSIQKSDVGAKFIVSASHSTSKTNSDSIKLVLKPRNSMVEIFGSEEDERIVANIVGALKGVEAAELLVLDSFEVTLGFSVEKKVDAGIEVDISVFGVDTGGSNSSKVGNSLTLVFK